VGRRSENASASYLALFAARKSSGEKNLFTGGESLCAAGDSHSLGMGFEVNSAAPPRGTTFIAGLMMIAAIYLIVTGVLVAAGYASLATGAPLLNGMETMGPLIFFLAAVLLAVCAVALFKLRRWARRAAILFAAWFLANAVPTVSEAVAGARLWPLARGGAIIIGSIVGIRYLMDEDVRAAFVKLPRT
jgi:hypothetical protein